MLPVHLLPLPIFVQALTELKMINHFSFTTVVRLLTVRNEFLLVFMHVSKISDLFGHEIVKGTTAVQNHPKRRGHKKSNRCVAFVE